MPCYNFSQYVEYSLSEDLFLTLLVIVNNNDGKTVQRSSPEIHQYSMTRGYHHNSNDIGFHCITIC